jgi:hypothetical protein
MPRIKNGNRALLNILARIQRASRCTWNCVSILDDAGTGQEINNAAFANQN